VKSLAPSLEELTTLAKQCNLAWRVFRSDYLDQAGVWLCEPNSPRGKWTCLHRGVGDTYEATKRDCADWLRQKRAEVAP
jgi:hypothetical protein